MTLDTLPGDLPEPLDDGAADHLTGLTMPALTLPATMGGSVNLSRQGLSVFFIYPMTGRPDQRLPTGWDDIPGARGCTPQSCQFRDLHAEFDALGFSVFGISAQVPQDQREASHRLHLPYPLLSDVRLALKSELKLPTFTVDGRELYKRLTLIVRQGQIDKCFYPVYPPDKNADEVLQWIHTES